MRGRLFADLLFRPLVIVPMGFCVAGAFTFGAMFGLDGFCAGSFIGLGLGLAAAYVWHRVFTVGDHERQERFRQALVQDALEGRLGGRVSVRRARSSVPEPIPLEGGSSPAPQVLPPVEVATGLPEALAHIEERARTDLRSAIEAADALRELRPRDGRAAALLADLLLRADRPAEACRVASDAMQIAVLAGDPETAAGALATFWDHRRELMLEPATALAIGEWSAARGDVRGARHCLGEAERQGSPASRTERLRAALERVPR